MQKISINGVEVFVEPEEKYLQINDINEADLGKIWGLVLGEYGDYDKWLCYHSTIPPTSLIEEVGGVLVDDSVEMRLVPNQFCPAQFLGVQRLTKADFDEFAQLHDRLNPDMYWNSQRMVQDLSHWAVFVVLNGGKITAYTMLALWNWEIYKVAAETISQNAALITAAAQFAFENGAKELLYMADDGTNAHQAALKTGFLQTGFYKGYKL
ncbi:MAG: hypothetical protein FWE21_04760 [Defluviitaleaceae bacterium]|nr:hypothetical protein [Defluviitaleaceae bacterium]